MSNERESLQGGFDESGVGEDPKIKVIWQFDNETQVVEYTVSEFLAQTETPGTRLNMYVGGKRDLALTHTADHGAAQSTESQAKPQYELAGDDQIIANLSSRIAELQHEVDRLNVAWKEDSQIMKDDEKRIAELEETLRLAASERDDFLRELAEARSDYWYRKGKGAENVADENKRIFAMLEEKERDNARLEGVIKNRDEALRWFEKELAEARADYRVLAKTERLLRDGLIKERDELRAEVEKLRKESDRDLARIHRQSAIMADVEKKNEELCELVREAESVIRDNEELTTEGAAWLKRAREVSGRLTRTDCG